MPSLVEVAKKLRNVVAGLREAVAEGNANAVVMTGLKRSVGGKISCGSVFAGLGEVLQSADKR